MLTFIELLIGVVVIVGVARYIIKGYSATGVLFVGGLLLLIISAIMGHKVLPSSRGLQQATAPRISLNTLKYIANEPRRRPRHDDYDAVWLCRLHDPYRRE